MSDVCLCSGSVEPELQHTRIVGDKSRLHPKCPSRVLSVMAFHEKAGRSQGNSGFMLSCFLSQRKVVLPPSSHCRHASIRTLEERIVSLGACWAFSIQPVLPSDWRPVVLLFESGTRARPLTQSPELGFRLFDFPLLEPFDFFAFVLRSRRHCRSAAVVQRLVDFSAHPEVMQQHRQLACGGDDGSLLSALSAALG
jgi:hypothetical protein